MQALDARRSNLLLIFELVLPSEHETRPLHLLIHLSARGAAFVLLVSPVRGDAKLGSAMHRCSADLNFERAVGIITHDGVQRLITVALGRGDVILHATIHRSPETVHVVEHGAAGGFAGFVILTVSDDDANRTNVHDIFQCLVFLNHFLVHGIQRLLTTAHVNDFDVMTRERFVELGQRGDNGVALCARFQS